MLRLYYWRRLSARSEKAFTFIVPFSLLIPRRDVFIPVGFAIRRLLFYRRHQLFWFPASWKPHFALPLWTFCFQLCRIRCSRRAGTTFCWRPVRREERSSPQTTLVTSAVVVVVVVVFLPRHTNMYTFWASIICRPIYIITLGVSRIILSTGQCHPIFSSTLVTSRNYISYYMHSAVVF